MKTTFMTHFFLLLMAYFSFTYTFRIVPDCYCGCIVDILTFLLVSVQSIIQKCVLCTCGGAEGVDPY